MTYKKPLKFFEGDTLMGVSISAEDTATSRIGSDAIESFEAHKIIKTEAENSVILTPFHAVKTAMYAVMTEDAERTDPYCGGGTEPIDYGELLGEFKSHEYTSSAFCEYDHLAPDSLEGDIPISTIVVGDSAGTAELPPGYGDVYLHDTPLTYSNGITLTCEVDADQEIDSTALVLQGYPDGTEFTLYYKYK